MNEIQLLQYVNQFPEYYAKGIKDAKQIGLTPQMIRGWAEFIIPAAYKATEANVANQDLFERGLSQIFDGIADLLEAGK